MQEILSLSECGNPDFCCWQKSLFWQFVMGCSSSHHPNNVEKQGVNNSEHSSSSVLNSKSEITDKSFVTQRAEARKEAPIFNSESDVRDGEVTTEHCFETDDIQCNTIESKEEIVECNSENTENVQKSPKPKNEVEEQNNDKNNTAAEQSTKGTDV